jgi:hypothetical protein
VSATSRQPWSMTKAWPRFFLSTISVTPGLARCGSAGAAPGIWFAFGAPGAGVPGFHRTHRQAGDLLGQADPAHRHRRRRGALRLRTRTSQVIGKDRPGAPGVLPSQPIPQCLLRHAQLF